MAPASRSAPRPSLPRAPCAHEEDEFVVDLAGVPGDTRGRQRLATAREHWDRSEAGPSGAGARLAAPATAGAHSQRALSSIALVIRNLRNR